MATCTDIEALLDSVACHRDCALRHSLFYYGTIVKLSLIIIIRCPSFKWKHTTSDLAFLSHSNLFFSVYTGLVRASVIRQRMERLRSFLIAPKLKSWAEKIPSTSSRLGLYLNVSITTRQPRTPRFQYLGSVHLAIVHYKRR